MKLAQIKLKLNKLLIFNKELLRNFERRPNVLDANLKYWLKQGEIIALKKGLYTFKEREQQNDLGIFLEYIANQMIQPSYVSLEYVMAKYQLLSEPVNSLTSITTKGTREIINTLGAFRYYSIAPKIFTGYTVKYFKDAPIFEAKKPKAVFDYLYLRFIKKKTINKKIIEELRINWENLKKTEFNQIENYAVLSGQKKIKNVLKLIKEMYYA